MVLPINTDDLLATLGDPQFQAFASNIVPVNALAPAPDDTAPAPAPDNAVTGDTNAPVATPTPEAADTPSPDTVQASPTPAVQQATPARVAPTPAPESSTTPPPDNAPNTKTAEATPQPTPNTTNAKRDTGQAPSYGTQVASVESGGDYSAYNRQGYAGKYQLGESALAAAGAYQPAEGEDLSKNQWAGKIVIPGYAPMSIQEFLHNPQAQEVAWGMHQNHIDQEIRTRGLSQYYGQTIGGVPINRDTIASMMQIGGPEGAERFIRTNGAYNPADANGTTLSAFALKTTGHGGSSTPASTATTAASPFPSFTSMQSLFGPVQQAYADYLKAQPQIWQQLAQMQKDYLQAAKPTQMDNINDAFAQWAQNQIATAGLRHSSAGSILFNQVPDMRGALQAAQNAQRAEQLARQRRLDVSRDAYNMGSQNLMAQLKQMGDNLTAQSGLTNNMAQYGLNSGKLAVQMAQFGAEQTKQAYDYINTAIPNRNAASAAQSIFSSLGDPSRRSPADNMKVASAVVDAVHRSGMQLETTTPAQWQMFTWVDPKDGQQHVELFNTALATEQARLQQFQKEHPNGQPTTLGTQQINITNSGNTIGGQKEGEGGSRSQTPQEALGNSVQATQIAKAALNLVSYMKATGGTSVLTDSEIAKAGFGALKSLFGIDPTGQTARQLYGKLMTQLQNTSTLQQMRLLGGRPTGGEFARIQQGLIGSTGDIDAAEVYLKHTIQEMDWFQRYTVAQSVAQQQAQIEKKVFNPVVFYNNYIKSDPYPGWDLEAAGVSPETPAGAPQTLGQRVTGAATETVQKARELGGKVKSAIEPAPAPAQPAQPANPPAVTTAPAAPQAQTPNVLPVSPSMSRKLRGEL